MLCKPINDKSWSVYNTSPFKMPAKYIIQTSDIELFFKAISEKFLHAIIKREYIDKLHEAPLASWGVFKSLYIVENGELKQLFIDYQGSYGYYRCDKNGWNDRLICYGN